MQKILVIKFFTELFKEKPKYRIGICLSGGSARGYAHIGILKALLEHGIRPEIISGTSMGALVGVLYAAGRSPEEIKKIFIEEPVKKVMVFSWQRTGLLKMDKLGEVLKKYLPEDNFSSLKTPCYVGLSNLNTTQTEFINTGQLYQTLIATSSVPGVFTPLVINGTSYVDGGLLCNLPASAIRDKCEILIGAHVNFPGKKKALSGTREILERAVNLGITQNTIPERKLCDFLIDPPEMQDYSLFDFSKIEEIMEAGYRHTIKMIEAGELPGGKKI